MMPKQLTSATEGGITLLGDHHPLVQQLGSAEDLLELNRISQELQVQPVQDVETLRNFLVGYQTTILLPLELPIIHQAFLHGIKNRLKELIELDQKVGTLERLAPFQSASERVGQAQLRRLRPLRDVRILQRYLNAVDSGEAKGWHTVVFGLTLAIYSVPLRQGLLGYAQQVMNGYIQRAARRFPLPAAETEEILQDLNAALPATLGTLLFLEDIERSKRG